MKFNDTHLIVLTTASQRSDGSLVTLPEQLGAAQDNMQKAIAALLRSGLVEEGAVDNPVAAWRQEGDKQIGIRIAQMGLVALGIEPVGPATGPVEDKHVEVFPATKAGHVLSLLQRPGGAVLDDLIAATGWQGHTVRVAITGLRTKGFKKVERAKCGAVSCWFVRAA